MIHIVVLLLVGLMSSLPAFAQETLTFTTEAYPPFSYRDDTGTNRGAGVDQVTTIMADVDSPFRIEIMP